MVESDLLLVNGTVHTLDPARPVASALAISAGRIAAVGDEHDIRELRGAGTKVIDLRGATVTPGLVDSHSHPIWGAATKTPTMMKPKFARSSLRSPTSFQKPVSRES